MVMSPSLASWRKGVVARGAADRSGRPAKFGSRSGPVQPRRRALRGQRNRGVAVVRRRYRLTRGPSLRRSREIGDSGEESDRASADSALADALAQVSDLRLSALMPRVVSGKAVSRT